MNLSTELIDAVANVADTPRFWEMVMPRIADKLRCETLAVIRAAKGALHGESVYGNAVSPPDGLAAEVLDRDELVIAGQWFGVPLARDPEPLVLLGSCPPRIPDQVAEPLGTLAEQLRYCLETIHHQERAVRRIERLQAILEIAAQWNQTQEMVQLLGNMAQASTQLLKAERASIFLWDRANKLLVGRPALGVEGNELRIPDTTGVVGRVVHSGQPERVDADESDEISRKVDDQLGFHTRNVLCIPLVSGTGKLFGALS